MSNTNYCCIPGCRTKHGQNPKFPDKSHIALFSQPKNEEELDRWCKAFQRIGKEMKTCDKVCELHFTEDCILKYFESLLPDGTVWRIKRSRRTLKPGSVPTIFPDPKNAPRKRKTENSIKISPEKEKLSKNTFSYIKKRKILNENLECQQSTLNEDPEHSTKTVHNISSKNAETVKNKNSEHIITTIKNNITKNAEIVENEKPEHPIIILSDNVLGNEGMVKSESSGYPTMTLNYDGSKTVVTVEDGNSELAEIILNETTEAFTYSTLVNNLKLISRPDWSWGISVHDEFIMCAKWNKDNTLMKRVIVDCNLKTRVFLKNRAIDFNNVKITSIKDLSSILFEVDRYRFCVNVDNREKTKCDGYILPKIKGIQCEYCRLIGDWEVKNKPYMYWISKGRHFAKHQILYEKIEILNKKNALLREQLGKFIKIKAVWKPPNQPNLNPTKG